MFTTGYSETQEPSQEMDTFVVDVGDGRTLSLHLAFDQLAPGVAQN